MHDPCCFFPNLKPFSVVVSWIRQENPHRSCVSPDIVILAVLFGALDDNTTLTSQQAPVGR